MHADNFQPISLNFHLPILDQSDRKTKPSTSRTGFPPSYFFHDLAHSASISDRFRADLTH